MKISKNLNLTYFLCIKLVNHIPFTRFSNDDTLLISEKIRRGTEYLVRMQENGDQKNSDYRYFYGSSGWCKRTLNVIFSNSNFVPWFCYLFSLVILRYWNFCWFSSYEESLEHLQLKHNQLLINSFDWKNQRCSQKPV